MAGLPVLSRSDPSSPLVKWRSVARQFHAIQTCCAARQLPADIEPVHLAEFPRVALTPSSQGVFAFLLHIWNSEHPFDLSQIQRWDRGHRAAFTAWVTGSATGVACEYF